MKTKSFEEMESKDHGKSSKWFALLIFSVYFLAIVKLGVLLYEHTTIFNL